MAGASSYNMMLKSRIQPTIIEYVVTENVLHVFHQYNLRVLTEIDLDNIRAEATMKGKIQGTLLLLDRLARYERWFDCLLCVLKDPGVRLQHAAAEVEEIKAALDLEFTLPHGPGADSPGSPENLAWTEVQVSPFTGVNPVSLVDIPAVSDFSLSHTDSVANVNNMAVETETDAAVFAEVPRVECIHTGAPATDENEPMSKDMPFRTKESKEKANGQRKDKNSAEVQEPPQRAAAPDVEGATAIFEDVSVEDENTYDEIDESDRSVHPYLVCERENVPTEYAPPPPLPDISRIPGARKPAREAASGPRARPVPTHGVEYDYSKEEVAQVLGRLPGWHSDISEQDVWSILTPHINEDGWYLLFYWDFKQRPAICVTERNSVKTLVMHKRPDPKNRGKIQFYFIDKAQKKTNTLLELVHYHLQNGVKNMAKGGDDRLIRFRKPVPCQTQKF